MERERQEQEENYELQKIQNQISWKSPFKLLLNLFFVEEGRIQVLGLFLRPHLLPSNRVSSGLKLIKEGSMTGLNPQGVSALPSQHWGYRYIPLFLAVFK